MDAATCTHHICKIIRRPDQHIFWCMNCDRHLRALYVPNEKCTHEKVMLFHTKKDRETIKAFRCMGCFDRVKPLISVTDAKGGPMTKDCPHQKLFVRTACHGSGSYTLVKCLGCEGYVSFTKELFQTLLF